MTSIELFDQNNKPYGPLSNNANFSMKINKEIWNNVTQFIYTNMVSNYVYRDEIKKSKPKNLYTNYVKYLKKTEEDIIAESLAEGMSVKFQNPDVLKILLSTGEKDIIYISNNKFLGIGFNKDGENIVGKYLVQFRNNIQNTTVKQGKLLEEQDKLYEAYTMYNILKKEIVENGNDLSDYLYLSMGSKKIFQYHLVRTVNDIMKIYFEKNPKGKQTFEKMINDTSNKKFFLELYDRKNPEYYPILKYSVNNSSVIILELRKKYLGKLTKQQNIIKHNKVFRMYLEYILEKNFPNIKKEDYENIIDQQLKEELKTKIHEDELLAKKEKLKQDEKVIIKEKEELRLNGELKNQENLLAFELEKIKNDPDLEDYKKEELTEMEKKKYILLAPSLEYKQKLKEDEIKNKEKELKKKQDDLEIEYNIKLFEEYIKLEKRVFDLIDQMPEPLKEKIEIFLSTFKTPSPEDVDFAETFNLESYNIKFDIDDIENIEFKHSFKPQENPNVIKIYQGNPSANYQEDLNLIKKNSYQVLSPVYFTGMLRIQGFDYPTITHYILAKLFANLPGIQTLQEAQKYILKDPSGETWSRNTPTNWIDYKSLYDKYYDVSIVVEDNKLKELCKLGLNTKFEDRTLQNLLLSTENKTLIWNDKNDTVLGIGKDKRGENFCGTYLTELRTIIFRNQERENLSVLTEENVSNIIENDLFMKEWVNMRVKDMCDITKKVRRYVSSKYKIRLELSAPLFSLVLNRIYQPCTDFKEMSKDVNADVPLYFISIVHSYIKNKYTPGIIKLLWKRVVVMIYFLIKSVRYPTLYNIKNILLKLELLISKQDSCVKIVKKNKKLNCIVSAVINVLMGIIKFSKKVDKLIPVDSYAVVNGKKVALEHDAIDSSIKTDDIELAISIILNRNISFELENKKIKLKEQQEQQEDEEPVEVDPEKMEEENAEEINDRQAYKDLEAEGLEGMYQEQEKENNESDEEEDIYGEESEAEENGEGDDSGDGYDGAGSDNIKRPKVRIGMIRQKYNNDTEDYISAQILKYLQENEILQTRNLPFVSKQIYNASIIINEYKMSEKIKNNRINFFATIR